MTRSAPVVSYLGRRTLRANHSVGACADPQIAADIVDLDGDHAEALVIVAYVVGPFAASGRGMAKYCVNSFYLLLVMQMARAC